MILKLPARVKIVSIPYITGHKSNLLLQTLLSSKAIVSIPYITGHKSNTDISDLLRELEVSIPYITGHKSNEFLKARGKDPEEFQSPT